MKVLRILTRANLGGPTRQALDLVRQDRQVGLQTLLVVGQCGPGETEMPFGDVPTLPLDSVDERSRGIVRVRRLGRAHRPWRDLFAVLELRRLIRRFRPAVVHTHTSQAGFFGRRAAFAEAVPVVAHTFHGHILRDYYPRPVNVLLRHLEAGLARRTDRLFAVSATCRDELHGMGIGSGRIEVIPPALDLSPFAAAKRADARRLLGLAADDFAVGLVGRLVPVKRPTMFAAMLDRLPDVRGIVFGTGPLAAAIDSRSNLELRGAVLDLHRSLAGLDALVLCSRREGCPLVALEAFAAGVPVVGLDVPGVRDALGAWGAGRLVPESEGAAGLAAAVAALRQSPDAARELVDRARNGLGRFAPAAVAATLRDAYAAGLARRTVAS